MKREELEFAADYEPKLKRQEDSLIILVRFYVQEYNSGSAVPAVEFIRGSDYGGGIGGILYSLRGGSASFSHYNNRGDVVAKTNGGGTLTFQASYEAYGKRTATQGSTLDRQKANTKDEDPSGLLNEGMRYRDLDSGTFITRDPMGFVDGPNVYAYVRQNPWSSIDPDGLKSKKVKIENKKSGFLKEKLLASSDTALSLHST